MKCKICDSELINTYKNKVLKLLLFCPSCNKLFMKSELK